MGEIGLGSQSGVGSGMAEFGSVGEMRVGASARLSLRWNDNRALASLRVWAGSGLDGVELGRRGSAWKERGEVRGLAAWI
jgi:hypothetical protein